MKYIVFRWGDRDVPVLFPDKLTHAHVAERMGEMLALSRARVVSAGEVSGLVVSATFGESSSLSLKARDGDARMINTYDYCHGMDNPNDAGIEKLVLEGMIKALQIRMNEL